MAWSAGSGRRRWPAGPAGARRRSPAGRRWPAVRAGGSGAWSSSHSVDGPDHPGRGVPGDGQPVQPDDAQERGLVGVGSGHHERVPSLDGGRAGHPGGGQVVPGCGLRGAGVDLDTLPADGGTGQDLFSADPGGLAAMSRARCWVWTWPPRSTASPTRMIITMLAVASQMLTDPRCRSPSVLAVVTAIISPYTNQGDWT